MVHVKRSKTVEENRPMTSFASVINHNTVKAELNVVALIARKNISLNFLDSLLETLHAGSEIYIFSQYPNGYQDSMFSIPPENPVSHFWTLVTSTISIIPHPIQISFHNSHCCKLQ